MSRWFRFYDEALNDPKVQRLPGDLFKVWVNFLCLASKSDGLVKRADVTFGLRFTDEKDVDVFIDKLIELDLIEVRRGVLMPHNWRKRQYKSDTSTPRVKRFRKRRRNVSETPPEQNRAETEQKDSSVEAAGAVVTKEPVITPEALSLSDRFLEAIGVARDDPQWFGTPYRAMMWVRHGWTEPIIVAASRKVMSGRKDIPNIKYFEKAIARAFADQNAPVPVAQPGVRHEKSGRNSGPAAGWQAARDDFRAARADLKRAIATAEGESDECGEGGGPPLRLVAPTGRG